ncbi:MAG: FAD-dependent oxidoreductase [Thermodesulfobacteriota bacterium]
MFNWDVVIVGGGPAGLTAGLYLSRAGQRVILLEKENFGGRIKNVEWIENYPGFAAGVSGPQLASEMVTQAAKYGLKLEQAEVVGIELFSSCQWVACAGGKGYTSATVIIAGGSRPKRLGVPGEEKLQGKGVFNCALCEGSEFTGRIVAVCGGGDAGVTEALYMANLASKVILIELEPQLTATPILQKRALGNPKLEIRCGVKIDAILGDSRVEAIELTPLGGGTKEILKVDGVLVYVGIEPNTSYLKGIVPLSRDLEIEVNDRMETEIPYLFAAGDIRSGSPRQISTAVGDGTTAAVSASRILREISPP